jgi:hypothetical protein
VLQLVLAHYLLHLVLDMEFEFFQTMFFQLFLLTESVLGFQGLNQLFVFLVFPNELTEFFIRLHQVRFDFFFGVLFHSGFSPQWSRLAKTALELVAGPAGSFTSLEVRTVTPSVYPDFTMNVFS